MIELSQKDWSSQLESDSESFIMDVRTQEEVDEGMIPEALHMDIYNGQKFISSLEKLDKSLGYYVYCRSGNRSAQACSIMDQLGFKSTFNLVGGFLGWTGPSVTP
jgi:rhodanese-related sulfurtransferase